ncbi:MAG: DUF3048 domain-containing protein [Chloroflexi bacterium]|nr:DUF3048 domain-containing protein [Chloroflexota bacterium]
MIRKLMFATLALAVVVGTFGFTAVSPAQGQSMAAASPLLLATPTRVAATQTPDGPVGPDTFPVGVNPLTGLEVKNPENLTLPPALVSITNFPPSARPQAGLSYSPIVFEMYIGEGMSRFLALFYGDYPQEAVNNPNANPNIVDAQIGPIRSGRLPYEHLRSLYNGFLVMASAYKTVAENLNAVTNIFGNDNDDINSAMINVNQLKEVAQNSSKQLPGVNALSGQMFDPQPPTNGKPGNMIWLPYNYLNQIIWRYDLQSGAYNRWQDNIDGKTFTVFTDRLNGEVLTYENVVILFATHHAYAETLIDVDLSYIDRGKALLFRDGQMYEIYWTTKNGEYERTTGRVRPIRFIDAEGNPVPLKPGQTWVEIVPPYVPYDEVVDSTDYMQLKTQKEPGSGNWAIHFTAPAIEPQQ